MRKPIASNEVAFLVRALLRASDAANAWLGLDSPGGAEAELPAEATMVQVHMS